MIQELRVWAPNAGAIDLAIENRNIPMKKSDNGWWTSDTYTARHGIDYSFRIDGRGTFPDPRSAWQPEGVHGPSRFFDHDLFSWDDKGWQQIPLASAIIYEIHIGTFTKEGTFDSATDYLDYLLKIGVTHIELMPVAEFPGDRGWGYDCVDLYAPHHTYGGPEGLKRFVNACHEAGLAVILDVVYNHLGPSGNYLSQFGNYFTKRYATPWGDAVNLDGPDSDEVRRFFIDNALMWLRQYHIDGLRLDAVHALLDTSAIHFLEQLSSEVRDLEAALGRHLILIAESDLNDPRVIKPPEIGGYGIHAQWNEDFHNALHAVLTGEHNGYYRDFGKLADLSEVLTKRFAYDGKYSPHRRRHHGRSAASLPVHKFVVCLQNHDHIGNRALGERICHLLSHGKCKIGAAIVLTSPFVPMLFQGEEWMASAPFLYFTGHTEQDLAEAVKKGRVSEFSAFGWRPEQIPDPQSFQTFLRSKLNWNEISLQQNTDLLQWYKSLINLRRHFPDLTDGNLSATRVLFDEAKCWLIIARGSVLIVCNLADIVQQINYPGIEKKNIELTSENNIKTDNNLIFMPPQSVAILTG